MGMAIGRHMCTIRCCFLCSFCCFGGLRGSMECIGSFGALELRMGFWVLGSVVDCFFFFFYFLCTYDIWHSLKPYSLHLLSFECL